MNHILRQKIRVYPCSSVVKIFTYSSRINSLKALNFFTKYLILSFLISCSSLVKPKQKEVRLVQSNQINFSIVGDIMIHQTQIVTAFNPKCNCYEYDSVFEPVKEFIEKPDVMMGNLETTFPGDPKEFSGYPQFGSPDTLADSLKKFGFDILSTSNNHCVDKGKKGLEHTLDVLDKQDIVHLGTYKDENDYKKNRVKLFEKNNLKLAFLSYTYSTNGIKIPKGNIVNVIDKKLIEEDMNIARELKPDFIIVYFHFGSEYLRQPDSFQKDIVNFTFNEGADIVLGGQPHVLQPYEYKKITDKNNITKQRLVIYSLGNFVSGQHTRYTNGGIFFNFSLNQKKYSDGKIEFSIDEIHYHPVFVYIATIKNKAQYLVLPVKKFLKNDQELKINQPWFDKMIEFYKDTEDHFKKYSIIEK